MVSEMAADPFVTAVGGTEILNPDYNENSVAQGYATETVWNDPDNGFPAGGATGGGASAIFSKPTYQIGPGVPDDDQRDIPDVALLAGSPRVFIGGDSGGATLQCCIGGTSLAAPLWAGVAKDIEAQLGPLGSINPTVYLLANLQYGSSNTPQGFHDITSGDNSFNGVAGFAAGTAYDQTTGWGSVDYSVFATAYKNFIGPVTTSMIPAPLAINFGSVDMGSSTKPKKITITNKGKNTAVVGTVSVSTGFAITADSCSNENIAAKKTCAVSVEFSPATYGGMSGSMMAPYNGGIATTTLLGVGIDLVEGPASVKFAPIAAGTTSPAKPVTLTNESATITVTMGATPAVSGPFVVGPDGCNGTTLKPHAHCTIMVAAMPPADAPSGDPIAGSLGPFTFTYAPSNSGTVPAVQLSGEAK
jgi:subtilase family serine protease